MDPMVNGLHGGSADRDNAVFSAFAEDANEAEVGVEVLHFQRAEFGDAEAARIEQFEHGLITESEGPIRVGLIEQACDLA
jgi:hypothetical protein